MSAADLERQHNAFLREYCKHPTSEIRRFTVAGGSEQIARQCMVCGLRHGPALPKDKAPYAKLSDDLLNEEYRAARDTESKRLKDAITQARREEYAAYRETPEWRELRAKILARDTYLCQGCLEAKATVVHHFTYTNVGYELCYELTSLCHDCHSRAHGKD